MEAFVTVTSAAVLAASFASANELRVLASFRPRI